IVAAGSLENLITGSGSRKSGTTSNGSIGSTGVPMKAVESIPAGSNAASRGGSLLVRLRRLTANTTAHSSPMVAHRARSAPLRDGIGLGAELSMGGLAVLVRAD